MRRPTIIAAALCLAIAIFAIIFAVTQLPSGNQGVPGPAFFPIIIAILIALAALLLLISYLRNRDLGALTWYTDDNKRSYLSFLGMVIYVVLLPVVGFVTMTTVFLALAIKWYGNKSWVYSILVGAVAAGAVFALFNFLFRVPLQFGFLI